MENDMTNQIQNPQKTHFKWWICVICVLLSISFAAIIFLGSALFDSNDRIAALQTDLDEANDAVEKLNTDLNEVNVTIEALNTEQKAAQSEIDALQSDLALASQEAEGLRADCEQLEADYEQLKEDLQKSIAQQETLAASMKESMEASIEELQKEFEKINQSTRDEIDRLKGELEALKKELAALNNQTSAPTEKIRIYIDQGHNPAPYHNGGAVGNGLYEQDVTFLVGSLLAELLRADGRFEIQLSRPNKSVVLGTDNDSSVMARVKGAAEFNADYFISLHTNAFTSDSANGIEVYVEEGVNASCVLGEALLDGLVTSTNLKNRGIKTNPELAVLRYSAMPAVLVEMGFITNSTDASLFSEHPELFAQGLYNGILNYFGFLSTTNTAS